MFAIPVYSISIVCAALLWVYSGLSGAIPTPEPVTEPVNNQTTTSTDGRNFISEVPTASKNAGALSPLDGVAVVGFASLLFICLIIGCLYCFEKFIRLCERLESKESRLPSAFPLGIDGPMLM